METLVTILTPAIASLAGILVTLLLAWIAKKFPISPEIQVKVAELAKDAILKVEEKAKEKAGAIKPPEKLAMAINFIEEAGKANPGVVKYSRDALERLVESLLKSKLTPDEVTPKSEEKAEV